MHRPDIPPHPHPPDGPPPGFSLHGILPLLPFALLTLIAGSRLLQAGWFQTHEFDWVLQRITLLSEEIAHDPLPPRWVSGAFYGKGSPMFTFYSPLAYLVPAYLHAAGIPLLVSLKAFLLSILFAGAWGTYVWVKRFCGITGGVMAGVTYLFLPYHFLDLYVRGALAEFCALAVLPWLFAGIDSLREGRGAIGGVVATALAASLTVLTHNLSALMIFPFAVAYLLLSPSPPAPPGLARRISLTAILTIGLTAFYWLPLLFEKRFLRDFAPLMTTGAFSVSRHFVSPVQLVAPGWGFGYSVPGEGDGMSFQLGIPLILLFLIAMAGVVLCRIPRPASRFVLLTGGLGIVSLFLTTPWSAPLYDLFPPIAYVQFPWRFLGPSTLFLTAASAAVALLFPSPRTGWWGVALLVIALVTLSSEQRQNRSPIPPQEIDRLERQWREKGTGSMTLADEYLPRWATPSVSRTVIPPRPLVPGGTVVCTEASPRRFICEIHSTSETVVAFPVHFFPGWKGVLDGSAAPLSPSPEGFVTLSVPAGRHTVTLGYGTTPPRVTGWTVTIVTLFSTLAFLTRTLTRSARRVD